MNGRSRAAARGQKGERNAREERVDDVEDVIDDLRDARRAAPAFTSSSVSSFVERLAAKLSATSSCSPLRRVVRSGGVRRSRRSRRLRSGLERIGLRDTARLVGG